MELEPFSRLCGSAEGRLKSCFKGVQRMARSVARGEGSGSEGTAGCSLQGVAAAGEVLPGLGLRSPPRS